VQRLPNPAPPWQVLNFDDPQTYPAAFAGVDRLFLLRPPHISDVDRSIKPVIDYAAAHGVRQIVFLSLIGAEKNKVVPHAGIEKLLLAGTVPYTLLRAGFFMQNLSTTHRLDIIEHDDVFVPAGKGKTAFVDTRDLAAVAALALTQPGHENKAYSLTGCEALDYGEVAAILSDVLGRPITYSDPSLLRFAWRMHARGNPWAYIGVMAAIYTTTRFGMAATVHPDLARLLGRQPITFREFAEDMAHVWQK
jgi:uncharacterized protein YbjT (DUF2867 family)